MKKLLFSTLLIPLPLLASPISEEAFDIVFGESEKVAEVTNHSNTLFIHTRHNITPLKSGKHYLMASCEAAALLEEWDNIDFEKIKVLNASKNQGFEWNVSPKICLRMIDKDLSNSEIDKIYFVEPYFRKF